MQQSIEWLCCDLWVCPSDFEVLKFSFFFFFSYWFVSYGFFVFYIV